MYVSNNDDGIIESDLINSNDDSSRTQKKKALPKGHSYSPATIVIAIFSSTCVSARPLLTMDSWLQQKCGWEVEHPLRPELACYRLKNGVVLLKKSIRQKSLHHSLKGRWWRHVGEKRVHISSHFLWTSDAFSFIQSPRCDHVWRCAVQFNDRDEEVSFSTFPILLNLIIRRFLTHWMVLMPSTDLFSATVAF